VRERLRMGVLTVRITPRKFPFRFPFPPAEVVEFLRTYYGPSNRTFAALNQKEQHALCNELIRLWTEHNQATDGTTYVVGEYLEIVALRG